MGQGAGRTGQIALVVAAITCGAGIVSGLWGIYQLAAFTTIVFIVVVCYVVHFGNTETPYGLILYLLTVGLVLQTTLLSPYLIGTDIHAEFYHTMQAALYGWNTAAFHAYSTSFTLVPMLAFLVEPEYLYVAYKLYIPLLFATVPVIAFYMFQSSFQDRIAFLGAVAIVAVPTFVIETVGMARQMLAMPFMAMVFYIVATGRIMTRKWFLAAVICGILASVSHYSTGVIMCFILAVAAVAMVAYNLIFKVHTSAHATALLCFVLVFIWWAYYYNVGQGTIVYQAYAKVAHLVPSIPQLSFLVDTMIPPVPPGAPEVLPPTVEAAASQYLDGYEYGMRMALGYGITRGPVVSQVFWALQYIIQLLITSGVGYVLWRHRHLNVRPEYCALIVAACTMLTICIAIPAFSALLNATRFYLFGMMILAPVGILAAIKMLGSPTRFIALLLIPYWAFSSGLVFEATQIDNIATMHMPYSIAMANHRLDLGGSLTADDANVRQYIIEHKAYPVYGDFYTAEFMTDTTPASNLVVTRAQMPLSEQNIGTSYIFVRARNTTDDVWVLWNGVGTREHVRLSETVIAKEIAGREVVYQSGDAVLYGPR